MKPITDDKYLQFVIQHYKDIEALNEVYEQATIKLPLIAAREVSHAILELRNTFFKEQGLQVKDDGDGPWWCDQKLYDEEEWKGPYFQFVANEKIKWEWLSSDDPEDAAQLVLYVDTGSIRKKADKLKYVTKWVNLLKARKSSLLGRGIIFEEEVDYRDPYLAYRPLQEVNIGWLADRGLFHKRIQQIVKDFTLPLLPVLRKGK